MMPQIHKHSNLLRIAALLAILLCATYSVSAQDWRVNPNSEKIDLKWSQLANQPLLLLKYGLFEDGKQVNEFYPSDFKETEMLLNSVEQGIKWLKVVEGNNPMEIAFDAKVSGNKLLTESPEEDIKWIELIAAEYHPETDHVVIFTVDNRGTYRYWVVLNKGRHYYIP